MAIIRNNNNNGTLTSDRRRDAFRGIIDRGEFQELSGSQQELLIRNTYAEADFGTYLYVLNNMKNMRRELNIKFDLDKLYYEIMILEKEYMEAKSVEAQKVIRELMNPKRERSQQIVKEPQNNNGDKKEESRQQEQTEIGKNMIDGFNAANFVTVKQQSQDLLKNSLENDQKRIEKSSVISGDIKYPDSWKEMKQSEKAEFLAKLVEAGKLPSQANPWGEIDNAAKIRITELYYKFLDYQGQRSICIFQFTTLRNFLLSPDFREKMRELNSEEKDMNNIFLQEVPISEYAPQCVGVYDMAFMVKCADKSKGILVLINSVPIYNNKIKEWMIQYEIQQITYGRKFWDPFRKRLTSPESVNIKPRTKNSSNGNVVQQQPIQQQQQPVVPIIMAPVNNVQQ